MLNHGIQFRGDCDDIIVRNLRIRVLTGGAEGDCLLFWGNQGGTVERVLVDHCSLMWATDEVVNTWGQVRDFTCQWTIIAGAQFPHSKGWLSGVGSDRISIHHCLFAHNADRVPKLEGGVYDVVNNVFYNWGHNNAAKIGAGAGQSGQQLVPSGADSTPGSGCIFPDDRDKGTKVFVAGTWPLHAHGSRGSMGERDVVPAGGRQMGGASARARRVPCPAPAADRTSHGTILRKKRLSWFWPAQRQGP